MCSIQRWESLKLTPIESVCFKFSERKGLPVLRNFRVGASHKSLCVCPYGISILGMLHDLLLLWGCGSLD